MVKPSDLKVGQVVEALWVEPPTIHIRVKKLYHGPHGAIEGPRLNKKTGARIFRSYTYYARVVDLVRIIKQPEEVKP